MGVVFWRKESWFYRVFTPVALGGIVLTWAAVVLFIDRGYVWTQLQSSFKAGQISYLYQRSYPAVASAAIVTAIADAVRQWLTHRDEKNLME